MGFYISYWNYRGGVNNLCIAQDHDTGLQASSTKGKEQAIRNLRKQLNKFYSKR